MCLYVIRAIANRLVTCPCLSPSAFWETVPPLATLSTVNSLENGKTQDTTGYRRVQLGRLKRFAL